MSFRDGLIIAFTRVFGAPVQYTPLIPAPGSGFAGPSAGSSGNPGRNVKSAKFALGPRFRGDERKCVAPNVAAGCAGAMQAGYALG